MASSKVDLASTTSPLSAQYHVISTTSARCLGVYVNTTLSAHALNIVDHNTTASPNYTRTLAVIPASASAGTFYPFPGGLTARTTLKLQLTNAAATGDVTVLWEKGVPGVVT
jgi:hypothetical protein